MNKVEKYIKLGSIVSYSTKRISLSELNLDNYVTTDNLLQNKVGVVRATNLPPKVANVSRFDSGNILVSNIRPYLKKIWFADKYGGCSADVLNFEVNGDFDSRYVYYTLSLDDFFVHMMKGAKGSKMPRGDKNQVLNYQIPKFSKDYQLKLSNHISVIDLKISLNNKVNRELEELAKTLYSYWFIQFDFPDERGNPYKSSGGKMVWNNILKKEIPYGWELENLFEVMDVQYGFPFSTKSFTDIETNMPVVRIRDILDNTVSTYTTESVEDKYLLKQNDLLVGMDGNFHLNFWDKDGAYLNQRSVRIRSKVESSVSNLQVFFEISPYIKSRELTTSRTTVGHLSDKDLRRVFLISPKTSNNFQPKKIFDSILTKITTNRLENRELSTFKEWILPKLIYQQLKIS